MELSNICYVNIHFVGTNMQNGVYLRKDEVRRSRNFYSLPSFVLKIVCQRVDANLRIFHRRNPCHESNFRDQYLYTSNTFGPWYISFARRRWSVVSVVTFLHRNPIFQTVISFSGSGTIDLADGMQCQHLMRRRVPCSTNQSRIGDHSAHNAR